MSVWDADPALGRVGVVRRADRPTGRGARPSFYEDGCPPLLVGVLKGAFIFLADLARKIGLPVEIDFMAVSSYGTATKTSGVVRILKDLDIDLTGRHVLIVEDILDCGLTLSYLRNSFLARRPASLAVCALLVKGGCSGPTRARLRGVPIQPDFVVGYGLDVAERYRNLPYILRSSTRTTAGASARGGLCAPEHETHERYRDRPGRGSERTAFDRSRPGIRAVRELLVAVGEDPAGPV